MVDQLSPLPPTSEAPQVLKDLRVATGAQHHSLEQRLPFMSPVLDDVLYRQLIQAYFGFYLPLEQRLDASGALAPERRKVPALRQDLLALGIDAKNLERCGDLPTASDPWQVLGILYVIEGATLGGQVLRRVVGERLGIDADNGGAFLDVYGKATGPLWKEFLTRLSSVQTPEQRARVVESAVATFLCFERWLEHAEVLR